MKRILTSKWNLALMLISLILTLSACGGKSPAIQGSETLSSATQSLPTPTLTPEPPKVLNVCLAEDPGSLYRYDGRNTLSKQSVFAAIYDPEILFEAQPSYENSLAVYSAVDVKAGMMVLDGKGQIAVLKEGSLISPAIDGGLGAPTAWSASVPSQMMQVSAKFQITSGLLWSDGSPIKTADFLLSFQVAKDLRGARDIWLIDRTASLEAPDDTTLIWTGVPGFVPLDFSDLIFPPIPAAQFSGMSTEEIGRAPEAINLPIGWGAYRIVSRDANIWLERNPYFSPRAPYDQVVMVIEPDLQQAIGKLNNGACDVLDPSYHLEAQGAEVLTELTGSGSLVAERFELAQQLVFGIKPAFFDGGYSQWTATRQDLFGDLRTRQAIAACLTAEPIASEILGARLPQGFSLPAFPTLGNTADPRALLDEIGWKLDETQPNSPRKANGVENVLDGTVFSVVLLSGTSAMDQEVSQSVVRRLAGCGIEVKHQALPALELYNPGPDGPLFGRKFDLALVTWQEMPGGTCELYRSGEVPNSQNYWIGTNLAGLSEAGFDESCAASENALLAANAQDGMAEYLPAVPLMPQIKLWFASNRVELAGSSSFNQIGLWRAAD